MFEFAVDQASQLHSPTQGDSAVVMPVACTSRPGQAYEVLCALATQLNSAGRDAVIVDGSAQEVGASRGRDGRHFGLLHALEDPSVSGLGAPGPASEWLVMPGAIGLQRLQQTARAAGAAVALSRLLAPFSASTVVLLYAPAATLSALLAGLNAHAIVPVLDMPQATIDAYASVKLLHGAGLTPVLAPMASMVEPTQAPLGQVVRSVRDCAERYLGYDVEQWPLSSWGEQVQKVAFSASLPQSSPLGEDAAGALKYLGQTALAPTLSS
jgi:hypothetical protein